MRSVGCMLAGLLLVAALGSPQAEAAGAMTPAAKSTAVAAAWRAESSNLIADCIDAKGSATLQLLAYPLSGQARSMKPKQARAVLKAYFKRLSVETLLDVTPKLSPANVRLFDYTYKTDGKNTRTTRLHIQLKQDKNRLWVLASVTESRKPRR